MQLLLGHFNRIGGSSLSWLLRVTAIMIKPLRKVTSGGLSPTILQNQPINTGPDFQINTFNEPVICIDTTAIRGSRQAQTRFLICVALRFTRGPYCLVEFKQF